MKNIILIVLVSVFAITFSGCAGSKPKPLTKRSNAIYGSIGNTSNIENTAIILKEIAKEGSSKGYDYVIIKVKGEKSPVPLTKYSDLMEYCYPSNSSFENKCIFRRIGSRTNSNGKVLVQYAFRKKPEFNRSSWLIKQMLNDKKLNDKVNKALSKFENKTITFK